MYSKNSVRAVEPQEFHRGLAACVRNATCVAIAPAIKSTDKPPWRQAMECHLSKLTVEQLAEISCPTSPEDLFKMLQEVYKGAKSKKTAKLLDFLSTYTQPLQQFQGAVDVIVGTSGGIGCPIWAPMKVALVMMSNNGKAYDIFAAQLTLLARKLPVYEKYSQIFSTSEDLSNALALVYADYLDFCVRVVTHFRRNGAINTFRSVGRPFEEEFKEVLANIGSNVERVEDAVRVAGFAEQAAAFREQISTHEAVRREKTLKWLSPSIFDSELAEFRRNWVPGTCDWIKDTDEYKRWTEEGESSIQPRMLWFPWLAGYGKSFIAHFVRDSLSRSPSPVLYFFFNSKQENSGKRTAIAFLRTIIYQLLTALSDLKLLATCFSILYPVVEKSGHNEASSIEELWGAAEEVLAQIPIIHLVIDALDECNIEERIELLEKLSSITKSTKSFKVTITSRPELEILGYLDKAPEVELLKLCFSKKHADHDLKIYAKSRLQKSKNFVDTKLQREISEKILNRADGMFLYVRLIIDELELETTISAVRKKLKRLPSSLTDYYNTVIQTISKRSASRRQLARDIFLWAVTTYRPLKLHELLSALETQRNGLQQNEEERDVDWPLLGDPCKQIREACFPLIEILEDQTVQVVHTSVTQYLLRQQIDGNIADDIPITQFSYEIAKAHSEVALVTLQLLLSTPGRESADNFQLSRIDGRAPTNGSDTEQIVSKDVSSPEDTENFRSYCVMAWNRHIGQAEAHFQDHRQALLAFCQEGSKAFSNWIQARCFVDFRFKLHFRLKLAPIEPSPLHVAVYFNLFKFANVLIAGGASLEAKDETGASPLHVAAEQGYDKLVQRLLEAGADRESRDKSGKTALHRSALKGHLASARHLSGSGIDCLDKLNRSALFLASRYGREDVVEDLLKNGANPSSRSISGETPLSAAVANGHLQVVQILFATGKQYNLLEDRQGLCHLVAARKGFPQILKLLLQKNSAIINRVDRNDRTVLHIAASGGHGAVVEMLLKAGADVNANDHYYHTALLSATSRGHGAVVEILLKAGVDVNLKNRYSETALRSAALGGHGAVVEILLKAGADVDAKDDNGQTALRLAASGGHGTVIEMLLKAGVDVHAKDRSGMTALHLAALGGHGAVVEMLLKAGADVDAKDRYGETALRLVASGGHGAVVEMLLKAGADVHAKHDSSGAALLSAASGGHGAVVEMLLKAGADVDAKDRYSRTALFLAALGGHGAVVEMLLKAGADVHANDHFSQTALRSAALGGHGAVVEILLKAGADVDAKDRYSQTALYLAALGGHGAVVEMLLKAGADVNLKDHNDQTALHLAALGGHGTVVEMLLKAGADVHATHDNGQTALLSAASGGHGAVVEMLLKAGADPDRGSEVGEDEEGGCGGSEKEGVGEEEEEEEAEERGFKAASSGNGAVVEMLLKAGVNVYTKDHYGQTALRSAASGGHGTMVEMLLKIGAEVDAKDHYGQTALRLAASGGHGAVVEMLLKAGADVNANDRYYHTALLSAALGGHGAVVEILLKAGAYVDVRDQYGQTALRSAVLGGHGAVVEMLLKAGVDVDAKDNNGKTALHLAALGGYEMVVELLLKGGSDVNQVSSGTKEVALHIAAKQGHEAVVQILLDAGSEIDAVDNEGRTPLHFACEKGFLGIVEELLEAGADDSIRDEGGKAPVDLAAERGDKALLALFP